MLPRRVRHPPASAPPHAGPRRPADSRGDAGAQRALPASPPPTPVPAASGPVPTLATGSRPTPSLRGARRRALRSDLPPAEGAQPEAARAPRVTRSHGRASPRRSAAGTWVRLRGQAAPLFRLPGLAFPGSGVGEGRRESFRHFQLPPPAPRPREGRVRAARAPPFQRAARDPRRGAAGRRTATASGLGPFAERAPGGGVVPSGATRKGSRRATRWLGLDCCTFFFVRCIFRNKKKSPTLHTTSSASLNTRSLATSVWGDRDHCLPRSPQPGWVGRAFVLGPVPGLQLEHNQNRLTVAPTPGPNLAPVSFQALG